MDKILRPVVYSPRRFKRLIEWLLANGKKLKVREQTTIEVTNAHLILRDPQNRLIFDEGRKMNVAFAIADFVHMFMGREDADFLNWIVPAIDGFIDHKKGKGKLGGAYGPRIVYGETDGQIKDVINRLSRDPNSRQAVISIYHGPTDLQALPHIVPCTLSLQFMIRDSQLHLIANMRSNDITWGLTYDVFNFTMIQEFIAVQLGIPLGNYYHNAGSLHLYKERDEKMVKALRGGRYILKMNPMPKTFNIHKLEACLIAARNLITRKFWEEIEQAADQYTRDLALTVRYWAARKTAPYEAGAAYRAIKDLAIRKMLRLWPIKR